MSFLKIILIVCIALFAIPTYSTPSMIVKITSSIQGGGIIVMDDIIMAVTVNNHQDPIQEVVVRQQNDVVYQSSGCGSNSCDFDLSGLGAGTYTATVYTEQGDEFSAPIQL